MLFERPSLRDTETKEKKKQCFLVRYRLALYPVTDIGESYSCFKCRQSRLLSEHSSAVATQLCRYSPSGNRFLPWPWKHVGEGWSENSWALLPLAFPFDFLTHAPGKVDESVAPGGIPWRPLAPGSSGAPSQSLRRTRGSNYSWPQVDQLCRKDGTLASFAEFDTPAGPSKFSQL